MGGAGLCAVGTQALTVTGNVFRRCGKDSNLLAAGERSCQVRLEGCRGLAMTGNALHQGYMQEKIVDLGGHGEEFILKDNVGCPMK